ncbi:MAG TPA: hypothetical protein VJS92_05290, partial [Candidatus Polarisedimenticolaceae bacterium]|nr:hypothetical protein [Candidatus Polarisedimenticolaceae bacterium]
GRAARVRFLAERGGPGRARWADAAFAWAADALFRRLVLLEPFLHWAGVAPSGELAADLRFEDSVAVRRSWSYLSLTGQAGVAPEPAEVERVLQRAMALPASPGDVAAALTPESTAAARLRGTVLALLLEERLLRRHDRNWFAARGAVKLLQECWDAEWGRTAESVAETLDLGRMDSTPVLERCRP